MSQGNNGFSRRDFIKQSAIGLGAVLGGSSLLAACSPKSEGGSAAVKGGKKVTSCYLPITDATPIILAHELGFYKELGIDSERPVLIRGWAPMAEAFMAGRFNLTHLLAPIPIYMRYSKNFPVKVVAWDHINGSAITVGKESGIKSYADLGGKQIAIPYWYSMHNIILQMIAREYGIEPVIQSKTAPLSSKQVNLFVMAPPDMPTAIASNAIDGYIVAEPFNAAGEVLAGGRIVRFTGDVWKNHPCCVAVMNEKDIADQEWSHKVIQALVKAELWALNNPEQAAHILSKDGSKYLPLPEKIVKRAMMKYDLETYGPSGTGAIKHPEWNARRLSYEPYQFESATRHMVEMMKQTRMDGDTSFLQKLDPGRVHSELMYTAGVEAAASALGGLTQFAAIDPKQPTVREEIISI
ncbi:twin-arginine translocation pathway signal [Chlorobaculum parvum NCIB 8327]|uniref:Twin-arginine translocation pathway signal n=1 Tax=Chlorobaculum parvum (strain DSM 263 / NCIMB 8327) TaxID=517417 RepID=B3QNV1_CHLP8|nr:ABC transporter substrate-binding protein [Chlorobaculum parvum]ACF11604.1 twin-arginine translocation pathway signal [Chlorobaculum parvum NCIB 8327]